jgi:hypothetical protein
VVSVLYQQSKLSCLLYFFTPYKLLDCFLFDTPERSCLPLIALYLIPIRSLILAPLIKIIECCCKLWDSPGIFTRIVCFECGTLLFVIFLFAEFGFFGFMLKTLIQMHLFCGFLFSLMLLIFLLLNFLFFSVNFFIICISLRYALELNQKETLISML